MQWARFSPTGLNLLILSLGHCVEKNSEVRSELIKKKRQSSQLGLPKAGEQKVSTEATRLLFLQVDQFVISATCPLVSPVSGIVTSLPGEEGVA